MIRKRNNKRILYESIMKDVAKTIKRNLNETADSYDEVRHNDCSEIWEIIEDAFQECDVYSQIVDLIDDDESEVDLELLKSKYLGHGISEMIYNNILFNILGMKPDGKNNFPSCDKW